MQAKRQPGSLRQVISIACVELSDALAILSVRVLGKQVDRATIGELFDDNDPADSVDGPLPMQPPLSAEALAMLASRDTIPTASFDSQPANKPLNGSIASRVRKGF